MDEYTPDTLIDMRPQPDFFLHKATVDFAGPIIGAFGLGVYTILARHDKAGRNGQYGVQVSHRDLAKALRCSTRQIGRTICLLEELGLIEIETQYALDGGQAPNRYHLKEIATESTK